MIHVSRRIRRLCVAGAAAWLFCVPRVVAAQDKPVGEAPEERDADEIFLRDQRVLLGRRDFVLDFGQF